MTKTEQAQELFTVVTNVEVSANERLLAAAQLTSLKKAAKVSFAKLGVDEAALNEAVEQVSQMNLAADEGVEDTTDELQGVETTEAAPRAGKRSERREQAKALLADVADKSRREQVQFLMDQMGLNANAAYYFARTLQA